MARQNRAVVSLALVALLGLALVQHSLTVVGEVWWGIPSWDSAATHAFEGLASLTPPHGNPLRPGRAHADLVEAEVLPRPAGESTPDRIVLSARITRSPPRASRQLIP